jgi:5-methylcytosine-specific restriction endonuclease McrA
MRLNPHKRYQTGLTLAEVRPQVLGDKGERLCRCGCGAPLPTKRHQWATPACVKDVLVEFRVLKGDGSTIRRLLWIRDKGVCRACGVVCWGGAPTSKAHHEAIKAEWTTCRQRGLEWKPDCWEADHIIPVEKGGGACGIEGFQTLCVECHKAKSAREAQTRLRDT